MSRMQGEYKGKLLTKYETKDSKASYALPSSGSSYQHSNPTYQSIYRTNTSGPSHGPSRQQKDPNYNSNRAPYTQASMLSASSSNSQLIGKNDVTKRLANQKAEAEKKFTISQQKNALLQKQNQKMKEDIKQLKRMNKELKQLLENRNGCQFTTMNQQPVLSQAKSIDSMEIVQLNSILAHQQAELYTQRSNTAQMVSKQTQTIDNWRIEAILKEKQKLQMQNASLKNDVESFRHLEAISNSNSRYVIQLEKMNASLKQEIEKVSDLRYSQLNRIERIKAIVMEEVTINQEPQQAQ